MIRKEPEEAAGGPLGKDLDKIMGDFWVIVNSEKPRTYILLPDEVRAMAKRAGKGATVAYWLETKNYAADEFEETWQRIGPA